MLIALAAVAAFATTIASVGGYSEPTEKPRQRHQIAAPLHYSDTVLVLADDKGVALIEFQCPSTKKPDVATTSEPVSYRFRYQAETEEEVKGDGLVFERYTPEDRGQLRIIAGHFNVEWSQGDTSMGWIYYMPEELRVQIANIKDFQTLDLDRFAH